MRATRYTKMTEHAQTVNRDSSANQWHRLSPLAVVYFIIKFTFQFLKESIFSLAPLLAIFITNVEQKLFWASIAGVALVSIMIGSSFLYYLNFRFRISKDEILVRKGVFKKERLTLNFGRIQNVNIATPFYFSPLGLVNCIFDSAGSIRSEINLPGVSLDYANQLRQQIFSHKEHAQSSDKTQAATQSEIQQTPNTIDNNNDGDLVIALSNWESAKFGFTSNMMLIVFVFFAGAMEHIIDWFEAAIVPHLMNFFISMAASEVNAKLFSIVAIVIAVAASFIIASVLGAWLRFFNYELYDEGHKVKRIAGLLERHQMSLSKHRVQAVSIKQNFMGKLLNRITVAYHQVSANITQGVNKKKQDFLVPMLLPESWQQYSQLALDDFNVDVMEFTAIHPAYLRKNIAVFWGIPSIILLFICINTELSLLLPLALVAVGSLITYLRYKRYGIWHNDEFAAIRDGFLGYKFYIFPLFKVQQAQLTQTPMQKRLGLAHIEIQLAFKRLKVPYVQEDILKPLINLALHKAENSDRHWM